MPSPHYEPLESDRASGIEVSVIKAKNITHSFRDQPVLTGVDIDVRPGEIVTLVGPNGAGKTTLVRILLGLVKPDSGLITRRPNLIVGYLPQMVETDPVLPLTVERLLRLAGRVSSENMLETLEETGAKHLINKSVHNLSGGELQRVFLARALLRRPGLLVLDEPVGGVDVAGRAELYDLITRIRTRRGCGVLMVSHDLHIVMASTDRVVCLNGHVCCSGHPEDVSQHPEYMAMFGPQAAPSLAVYTHHHDHHHDLSGEVEHDDHDHGHHDQEKTE